MQRSLALVAVLALCAPGLGQNLLTNPSFEAGMVGWTQFGGGAIQTGNHFGITPVDGQRYWDVVRSFGSTSCNGCEDKRDGLYQTVNLDAGDYVLRGYVQAYNNNQGFSYTPGAPSTDPGETWAQLGVDLTGGTDPLAASVTPTTARAGTHAQFEPQELRFTVPSAGPVTIFLISMSKWAFAGNWQAFDDIELVLDTCSDPSTVTSVTPPSVGNEPNPGVQLLTIEGTNLENVTAVELRGKSTVVGSIVSQSSSEIQANFDLTNAEIGRYDLIAKRNAPCADVFAVDIFRVTYTPQPFRNGGFEEGNPADGNDMPGWTYVQFRPWPGWGTPPPTLTKRTTAIYGYIAYPFEGTFFAGADHGGHANYHVGLVQSFTTVPGTRYRVTGGYFGVLEASNDTGWWEVKISDGVTEDPDAPGTLIAKKERLPGDGHLEFREEFDGTFAAASDTTTILLKWGRSESADYVYQVAGWDNIAIVATCNTPFADADNDDDVDLVDFALFQRCYTGDGLGPPPSGPGLEYCSCFDRDGQFDIDQADLADFLNCSTGPSIPWVAENTPNCQP